VLVGVKTGHSRIAASVAFGALSLAGASLGLVLMLRSGQTVHDALERAAMVGFFLGPLLAVGNMAYVIRDREAGRSMAAAAGLALSALSILATIRSLAWMD
jgi:hypothetical protein